MNDELIHEIACELIDAEENRVGIEQFTKNKLPDMTIDQAYHIQEALVQIKRVDGHKVIAPKMGLTSKAKWDELNVDTAIYGYIFDYMKVGNVIERSNYIQPKVEAEIVIALSEDMKGPNVTRDDVLNNIAYVCSAIEIIDSRYKDFDFRLNDLIADNSSAKGYILSDKTMSADQIDLVNEKVQIVKNNERVAGGTGYNILKHPAEAVAALVNILGEKGQTVRKGQPILTGGLTSSIEVEAGDVIEVIYSTLPTIKIEIK